MIRSLKFKSALTALAAAALLTACGSSDDVAATTQTVTQDIPAVVLSPSTLGTAKALASTLAGTEVALPAGALFSTEGAPELAAGTSLTFAALPAQLPLTVPTTLAVDGVTVDVRQNVISAMTISNGDEAFNGYVVAGSTYLCGTGTLGGVSYADFTCLKMSGTGLSIDANTSGLTGDSTSFQVAVIINTAAGTTTATKTVENIDVTINADGTFTLKDSTGAVIGSGETVEATGATGGANAGASTT